jgi:tetratricopeptide (TPR) repeat protein
MYRQLQDWDGVIEAYQKALKLVPSYVLALVNLADVYRLQQQDSKAEKLLLKAVAVTRKNAEQSMNDASDVHQSALQQQASVEYALGLLYARSKNYSKASVSLDNAARLSPQNADYFYAYLLILDALDQRDKAVDILQASPLTPSNKQLMALLQQWQS